MQKTYQYQTYPFEPCDELQSGVAARHAVIIVGAGPVGLTMANDLARQGIPSVILDGKNQVSDGSRAICFSKRTLEVFDRLGIVEPMRAKGVTWNIGKLFYRDQEVFSFNLLPEEGHAHPAFINLQQYYMEEYLIEAAERSPNIELRWSHKVVAVDPHDDFVRLTVETPAGTYHTEADWLIAADGSRSFIRKSLGLDYDGIVFEEKFLISDVVMKADFPPERWFWFDPPFVKGQSALLHMQPDNVWRIDIQLGRDADDEAEQQPERVIERIRAMLGPDIEFDLEWVSVYRFHSRRLDDFVHGRVIFVGDAAHIVSPFGARGANSGIQDVDNLVWKLQLVMSRQAPYEILESYNIERVHAAKENLLYTESSTEFISPNSPGGLALRNAVLELSQDYPFARPLINSGRLSTATVMADSPLNTADEAEFDTPLIPGGPCLDAQLAEAGQACYLLTYLGNNFNGILYTDNPAQISSHLLTELTQLAQAAIPIKPIIISQQPTEQATLQTIPLLHDETGQLRERYDMRDGTFYLSRPDQYVCGRWREFQRDKVQAALHKACCLATR